MLKRLVSMVRRLRAQQIQQPRLQMVDVPAGQLFEGFNAWLAADGERALQVRKQGERRFARRFRAVDQECREVKRQRFGDGEADNKVVEVLLKRHGGSGRYAAYLAWAERSA